MSAIRFALAFGLSFLFILNLSAEDPVFSGPQVGEKAASFRVRGVFGERDGKEFDPIAVANNRPALIVFMHQLTRPAFGLTRAVTQFAASRKKDGMSAFFVLLTDDMTKTEQWARRISRQFPKDVTLGISLDGQEGPGAYGLNRNITLTALVVNEGKVTGNFALVQPSTQADGPKILKALAEVLGDTEVPNILDWSARGGDARMMMADRRVRQMVSPMLKPDATKEDVAKTVAAIDNYLSEKPAAKAQVGAIANRLINSGRISNFNDLAQAQIRKWAEEFKSEAPRRGRGQANEDDPKLTGMLRRLINKNATAQQVKETAQQIEEYVTTNEIAMKQIARVSKTVSGSDRFSDYGTETAREYISKWAKKYNPASSDRPQK